MSRSKLLSAPQMTVRKPASMLAFTYASLWKYISKLEVMPLERYSMMASFVMTYSISGESFASRGNTCSLSQRSSGISSAIERRKVIAEWVCAFLKPGSSRSPLRSISRSNCGIAAFWGPT